MKTLQTLVCLFTIAAVLGCSPVPTVQSAGGGRAVPTATAGDVGPEYQIGPGDQLQIFVWRHDDVSAQLPVRPDGKISTPLVEDMQAAGKTPTQLARDIEEVLAEYIKNPVVTVIVVGFVGELTDKVRVVGQAMQPRSIPYRQSLTLLDVLIEVGGLTDLAAGRRAKIIRRVGAEMIEINVRPDVLLDKGDLRANVEMQPGDVLIIPEARF
ncbi:MAG: sugar ABC transporter substrate-binding protein [Gammaproteobacteria bacterium]|nr:sugar ABC transporter substrate-binding protein [Gammaproteobacteria bacterium]